MDKEFLIIGGTGSLGNALVKTLIEKYKYRGIRIYSRDEFKQWEMKDRLVAEYGDIINVSFLIGDVRDRVRLRRAMKGVNVVINAAAMKQVPACEYNPIEAVKTNIHGAENIIECALDQNVNFVMQVSTDKAVYPINLYGATKAVAEKLILHANAYTGGRGTKFSCSRYGNVLGSRGSIIPLFKKQIEEKKPITITDPEMTRFWITIEEAAQFIISMCYREEAGRIYIPKIPSCKITDIIKALTTNSMHNQAYNIIGIRQGEKLHETLISHEEGPFVESIVGYYIIHPYEVGHFDQTFNYSSNTPPFLSHKEVKECIDGLL